MQLVDMVLGIGQAVGQLAQFAPRPGGLDAGQLLEDRAGCFHWASSSAPPSAGRPAPPCACRAGAVFVEDLLGVVLDALEDGRRRPAPLLVDAAHLLALGVFLPRHAGVVVGQLAKGFFLLGVEVRLDLGGRLVALAEQLLLFGQGGQLERLAGLVIFLVQRLARARTVSWMAGSASARSAVRRAGPGAGSVDEQGGCFRS